MMPNKPESITANEELTAAQYVKLYLALLAVTLTAVATILIAGLTLFQTKNLYRRFLIRPGLRLILKIYGIRIRIHRKENLPAGQCIFISNHRSSLDFFVIGALGLRNTRYFISDVNRRFLAVRLLGLCVGAFYIPKQHLPEGRITCFRLAEEKLAETGDSVFLSPEGHKQPRYKLEPFNRGAFHMATNLKLPIAPFYIHVPEQVNIGKGFQARPGTVDVFFMKTIDTSSWKVEDIDRNKTATHKTFLDFETGVADLVGQQTIRDG